MKNKNEEFVTEFKFKDYEYEWVNYAHITKWRKPAYKFSKIVYKKVHKEKYVYKYGGDENGYEYEDKLKLHSSKHIILFKNERVELSPEKAEQLLKKKLETYEFGEYENILFGIVKNDSTIEWGLKITSETSKPPF